jgi:6-phosphogluconolactonase
MAVLPVDEYFFNDSDVLLQRLSDYCAKIMRQAVAQYGAATFLVSGGKTPQQLFRVLSKVDLPWQQITVALVDERCVSVKHEKSNARMVYENLLQNRASVARFVPMFDASLDAEPAVQLCEQRYRQLPAPIALALVGMGNDGHTASWFPGAEQLGEAMTTENFCLRLHAPSLSASEIPNRFTVSLNALSRAEKIVLLISGQEKKNVYQQALKGDDIGQMPIRALLNHKPIAVFWSEQN